MHIEEFEDCLISGDLFGRAHALTEGRSPSALLTLDGRKWLWAHLEPLQAELEPLALTMRTHHASNSASFGSRPYLRWKELHGVG
jgi:hypothetical protein